MRKVREKVLDLSISVVSWNTRELLRSCLKSIYENTHSIRYETFVVDNASGDGSSEMVKKEFPQVKLIRNEENLGFARANNQVIEKSRGRHLLLLNSDTLVLPKALENMVWFMNQHDQVGAAGCRLLMPNGNIQPSCSHFPTLSRLFLEEILLTRLLPRNRITIKYLGKYFENLWHYDLVKEVDCATGACLMVRMQTISDVGLLDENFFMYYEETDWCYRMRKQGWRICFVPDAQVIHYFCQSGGKDLTLVVNRSLSSLYYLIKKHQGTFPVVMLLPIMIGGALLSLFVLPTVYLVGYKRDKIIGACYRSWLTIRWHGDKLEKGFCRLSCFDRARTK